MSKISDRERKNKERLAARIVTHFDPPKDIVKKRTLNEKNLAKWLKFYLAELFSDEFSKDHLTIIKKIEKAIKKGGMFSLAMPRGQGKSTICKGALLFSMLTGARKYVVSVAATQELAEDFVLFLKTQLSENEILFEHYPHVCTYIRAIDGKAIKAKFQLQKNEKTTGLFWSKNSIRLPSIGNPNEYKSNGAIADAHGLTGSIRGKSKESNGKIIRPDLVIIDDPQTRESAESQSQCAARERIITGDILGLAGPRKKIACVMPCTIIRKGDLAHRFLDKSIHPEWQGETFQLISKWPDAQETLWAEYREIYKSEVAEGRGIKAATDFYKANRGDMDRGASVGWSKRVRNGEISALQTAENMLIELGDQFYAEMQNDPKKESNAAWELMPDDVQKHVSNIKRGVVPDLCSTLTIGADVNLYGISWTLSAWTEDGAGYVVDYGKYPPGRESVIWKQGMLQTEEQAIYSAITNCVQEIFSRPYTKQDGQRVSPSTIAIDCSFRRDAVYLALQTLRARFGAVQMLPIRGLPTMTYRPLKANRKGDGWHIADFGRAKALFHNSDIWRERTQKAWLMPIGSPGGSLAIYGNGSENHVEFSEQVSAEKVIDVLISEKNGQVYKWFVQPGQKNDLGDATVYSMVAACYAGVRFGWATEAEKVTAYLKKSRDNQPKEDKKEDIESQFRPDASQEMPRKNRAMPRRRGGFASAW